jgi:hypothetical protein
MGQAAVALTCQSLDDIEQVVLAVEECDLG